MLEQAARPGCGAGRRWDLSRWRLTMGCHESHAGEESSKRDGASCMSRKTGAGRCTRQAMQRRRKRSKPLGHAKER